MYCIMLTTNRITDFESKSCRKMMHFAYVIAINISYVDVLVTLVIHI